MQYQTRKDQSQEALRTRLSDAETRLASERDVLSYLTENNKPGAARHVQANILKIEAHVMKCRNELR